MTFAQMMREKRRALGWSEAKLAEVAGLPFATVHSYGLGRRKPSFAAGVKIARALGETCEAFAACDDVVSDGEVPEPARAKGRPPRAGHAGNSPGNAAPKKATNKRKGK